MKNVRLLAFAMALGLPAGVQAFAQAPSDQKPAQVATSAEKQQTQGSLPMVGPASGAYKQNTQGSLPMVGPASGAYKQNTQSMAHSEPPQGAMK
nr:hypothetical protein [uncultured Rhodopila sp.]